jgi:NitT/TauT family transport system substrate-binding protein
MTHDPARGLAPRRSGRRLRAWCLPAAVAGLTALLAAGCGGGSAPGGTVSSTVTIAAIPGVDTAPLYLAQRDGTFKAEGLTNVVIDNYATESAELSALANGRADIVASDYGDIFYAQAQKSADLRILADGYDAAAGVLEVITLPGSPITTPAQLAGAGVGVPDDEVLPGLVNTDHPNSLDSAAASEVLSTYLGNNVESVSWQPMTQQQEIAALQQHKIAAALLTAPYIYEAESELGATELFDACSGPAASLPLTGYVATNSWVRQNSAAVADFQAALGKAQTEAAMTGQVQTVLPKAAGMTTEDADLSTIGSYPTSISVNNLNRVVRLLSNSGMITTAPKVQQMIVTP